MSRTHIWGWAGAACLVACVVALPAAADGLSRFEEAMKQAPAGSLTYKSAKTLGDSGFVLDDVVLTPPPDKTPDSKTPGAKAEPIAIKRVSVEDFDFASVDKKLPPNFIKMRVEGILIGAKPAEGIDLSKLAGIDKITADFQLDYRLDPERKTMTLNRLEVDLNGLARLDLTMILDGVTADAVGKPDAAMNDATLRTATLTFEDRSLFSKVLPAAAKMQGVEADALVKIGTTVLNGLRAGQGPAALAALDAVGSYLDDYKAPKGPLRVTLNPPGKISAASLADIKDADGAVKALGLVVSYAGTRPQAPAAAAPPSTASVTPAPGAAAAAAAAAAAEVASTKPGCTPGARFFVTHENAWWSVTAREATQSGDKCVARIDSSDADVTFALGDTLAWSIDGPGKPAAQCRSGAKVVVAYKDGGWYPSKVTGDADAGAKCPIKYDSDSSEESVELKRVRRLD